MNTSNAVATEISSTVEPLEVRRLVLAETLAHHTRIGAGILNRTPTAAVVAYGRPVRHALHLLATLFTCGLWSVGWIATSLFTTRHRLLFIAVNDDGSVLTERVRR